MSCYTLNPQAAAAILAEQRRKDSATEARDLYDRAAIRARLAEKIAAEIAGRKDSEARRPISIGSEVVFNGVDFVRIAKNDDFTPIASMVHPAREAEARRFAAAEKDFAQVCAEETGAEVSPEEWHRQKSEREEIRTQSHKLAALLESQGVQAYRTDTFSLWIWHVHSKTAEVIPNFRRICLLPYIAAMVRAPKLAALEYYLQKNPFCRFWTFTTGERVGLEGLRARVEYLHAHLNDLNKELRRHCWGEFVFRSTELGTVETAESAGAARGKRAALAAHRAAVAAAAKNGERVRAFSRADHQKFADAAGGIDTDDKGNPLFHPHAHVIFQRRAAKMDPAEWDKMIKFIWAFWGHHWDAGAIINDAREACKYVTKPCDMLALGEKNPAALAALEKALHGLRLVCPLGSLKTEIRARKLAGLCLRRQRTSKGTVWREALDHNKHLAQDLADQEARFDLAQAEAIDRMDAKGGDWEHTGTLRRQSEAAICKVMARLAPAVGPRGLKEPRVIVGGNCFDKSAVMNHPLVSRLWSQTLEHWQAGLSIRVHTGTPTGETSPLGFWADVPERMAPPAEPVFAEV